METNSLDNKLKPKNLEDKKVTAPHSFIRKKSIDIEDKEIVKKHTEKRSWIVQRAASLYALCLVKKK